MERLIFALLPVNYKTRKAYVFFDIARQEASGIITRYKEREIIQVGKDIDSFGHPIHHKLTDDFRKHPRGGS